MLLHMLEGEQVMMSNMYLVGDAKLWWQTQSMDDMSASKPCIQTWGMLKKELKDQFYLLNATWLVRDELKKLVQMGFV